MLQFPPRQHLGFLTKIRFISSPPTFVIILGLFLAIGANITRADTLKVAVASNFHHVLESLKEKFQSQYGHTLDLHYGASGDLKDQVSDPARKFDMFLSADNVKTAELEQQNKVLEHSRKTYAQGLLAFWHGQGVLVKPENIKTYITENSPPAIHIADPEDAPYGHAAKSVLQQYELYQSLKDQEKLIVSDHVSEAWTNVQNASDAGFVPASLVIETDGNGNVIFFPVGVTLVPQSLYTPLLQELVIIKSTEHEAAAKSLSDFLLADDTQQFIATNGYLRAPVETDASGDMASAATTVHNHESFFLKGMLVLAAIKYGTLLIKAIVL
ncbi:molybdate ABC transporter substrate-binding protein [Endozoicomonas arenosclerae]|uniref:molybdate ABC transporter substrate-binding protein n=1 Tax=Endozoicomonas arenosclerae TaxID=1633495 RepID=UPI00078558C0|nr:molybdate ABC transporter substrate-binding protein [Endozoicomonas arenosclerae]